MSTISNWFPAKHQSHPGLVSALHCSAGLGEVRGLLMAVTLMTWESGEYQQQKTLRWPGSILGFDSTGKKSHVAGGGEGTGNRVEQVFCLRLLPTEKRGRSEFRKFKQRTWQQMNHMIHMNHWIDSYHEMWWQGAPDSMREKVTWHIQRFTKIHCSDQEDEPGCLKTVGPAGCIFTMPPKEIWPPEFHWWLFAFSILFDHWWLPWHTRRLVAFFPFCL